MFLTPNASLEKNLDEALQSLASYHEALERDFFVEEKEPKGVSARETSKIEEYAYLVQTGEELMRKGRLEDAINVFTEAIAIKPNFKALINRGDAYYKLRKVVAALNDYREAQKMLDTAPDPYAKISACCFTLAREAARSEDSGKARRWAEVGMKHINDAVGVIKKVQREAKNIPGMTAPATPYGPVLFALTEADFREMGLEDEWKRITELASRVIEETRDINADNQDVEIEARIDRAIILARNRHYEEAEKIFRDVTEKDPGSAGPAFNNFAVELRKNGEFGKAFEIYQELLKFRIPDREIVVENMVTAGLRYGATLRMAGRGEVATSVYLSVLGQRVREKTRQSVLCELAATCLETGAPAEASSRLMEAVYLNPALMKEPGFAARYPRLVELSAEMKDKLDEAAGKR
ncbi:MAG: tetratricopeptide repeat protein [Nitrospinae bacterium]|nr:tetratricopeptide repeat protein [Nitrospinota bacterium]